MNNNEMSKRITFDLKMRIDASENLHGRLQKMNKEELTQFVLQNTFKNNCREILNLNIISWGNLK